MAAQKMRVIRHISKKAKRSCWTADFMTAHLSMQQRLYKLIPSNRYQLSRDNLKMQKLQRRFGPIILVRSLLVSFPTTRISFNFLGIVSRRHSQPRQAENYYKHALRANPDYNWASYNLAATLAHSYQYDDNAKLSISVFEVRSSFVLPRLRTS